VVAVQGARLTLRIDLRKLDPSCFDTDEDAPRDQEIPHGPVVRRQDAAAGTTPRREPSAVPSWTSGGLG
jgi:hypothetical protein